MTDSFQAASSSQAASRPAPKSRKTDGHEALAIYLRDHRAGAAAGVRLARRCRDHAVGNERAVLADIADEIDEDGDRLDELMVTLDVRPSRVKMAGAVVGERLARLKLNGRLVRRSPLSRLMELEALASAVFTKRSLWASLMMVADELDGVDASALRELHTRARRQLERVEQLHDAAAAVLADTQAR